MTRDFEILNQLVKNFSKVNSEVEKLSVMYKLKEMLAYEKQFVEVEKQLTSLIYLESLTEGSLWDQFHEVFVSDYIGD